jgi:Ca2+-dependent lipid-binding protein
LVDSQLGLQIQIFEAKLDRDTETFGRMDPYCQLVHLPSGQKFKTATHEDGGKNPKWNHFVEIPIKSREESIQIEVYDEDVITD